MLESCSNPQKTWQVFQCALKENLVLRFGFLVSDLISGIGFWPFWLRLPAPGPKLLDGSISLNVLGN